MVPKLVVYKISTGLCLSVFLIHIYSYVWKSKENKTPQTKRQAVAFLHQYVFGDFYS